MSNTPDMQNNAFDDAIRRSLEDFEAGDFNPADWDRMEARLQQAQPAPGNDAAGKWYTGGKLGFAAAVVLVSALNILIYTRSTDKPAGLPANPTEIQSNSANGQAASHTPASDQEATMETNSPSGVASAPATIAGTDANLQVIPAAGQQLSVIADRTATEMVTPASAASKNSSRKVVSAKIKSGRFANYTSGQTYLTGANPKGNNWTPTSLPASATSTGNNASGSQTLVGCAGNSQPEILYAILGNDTIRDFNFTVAACELLSFKVVTADKNKEDKVSLISNVTRILPDAAMQLSTANNPTADFRLTAAPQLVRNEPYKFTMLVSDDRCATTGSNAYTFSIKVVPSQNIKVTATAAEIEKGEGTTLKVTGSDPKATITWLTTDGSLSALNTAEPEARPLKTTTYKVRITNPAGCALLDSVTVKVKQNLVAEANITREIPNFISPNGDGKNDFWVIDIPELGDIKVEVMDRWGNTIYRNNNYDNSWNASGLSDGTYFYIVTSAKTKKVYKNWLEVTR